MLRASAESILFTRIYSNDHPRARNSPTAYLLEIDGVRVLLDCGWTADFPVSCLEQLFPYLATVDCVLLSSPDILFCGALPFVLRHIRSGVPVVAPSSLTKIGTYNVLSHFMAAFGNAHEFQVPTSSAKSATLRFRVSTDDIFCSFRAVKEPYGNRTILRSLNVVNAEAARRRDAGAIGAADFDSTSEAPQYVPAETVAPNGALPAAVEQDLVASGAVANSAEIIAEPVGNHRVLGGHMWRLLYQSDDILYAPDFGLVPSLLLRPTPFPSRSTVALIGCADFYTASSSAKSAARQREAQQAAQQRQAVQLADVLRSVTDTLRREKDVLIPLSVAGRGLEFSLVLPKLLVEKGITNFKVVVAHYHIHELLSRIRTMTELLPDSLVYGDEDIFSRITPCRSAEEVLEVESPKLVFAEGMQLNHGIAADLLEHFLSSGVNLVLLTNYVCAVAEHAPIQSSSSYHNRNNAARLAAHSVSGNPNGPFSYTFDQRTKLSKAELEQHYVEEEEQLRREEAQLLFGVQRNREPGTLLRRKLRDVDDANDDDDDDRWDDASSNDDDVGGANQHRDGAQAQLPSQKPAVAPATALASAAQPQGLYLPTAFPPPQAAKALTSGRQHHLVFPVLEARKNVLTMQLPYGIPLSDEEIGFLRRTAPQRIIDDEAAPLDLIQAVNDAQVEARIPCKLTAVSVSLPHVFANVVVTHTALVEAFPETAALKHLLSSMFSNAQRIVPILCSVQEGRAVQQFVRSEPQLFRGLLRRQLPSLAQQPGTASNTAASVETFIRLPPAGAGVPLQLATEVFSYEVSLESRFAAAVQRSLSQVKESRSSGYWEIGMVNGELYDENLLLRAEEGDSDEPAAKKPRSEGAASRGPSSRLMLSFPQLLPHRRSSEVEDGANAEREGDDANKDKTAGGTIDDVAVGSVYVGTLELHRMRDAVRARRNHLRADIQRGLLVLGEGNSCVRKSQTGDATLSYLVGPDMFEWREALYEQFQKCL